MSLLSMSALLADQQEPGSCCVGPPVSQRIQGIFYTQKVLIEGEKKRVSCFLCVFYTLMREVGQAASSWQQPPLSLIFCPAGPSLARCPQAVPGTLVGALYIQHLELEEHQRNKPLGYSQQATWTRARLALNSGFCSLMCEGHI